MSEARKELPVEMSRRMVTYGIYAAEREEIRLLSMTST
jgi:hypothetical protein